MRKQFVEDNKIEATDAEIDAFIVKFNELSDSAPVPIPTDGVPEAELRAAERDIAVRMVATFKVNKAF